MCNPDEPEYPAPQPDANVHVELHVGRLTGVEIASGMDVRPAYVVLARDLADDSIAALGLYRALPAEEQLRLLLARAGEEPSPEIVWGCPSATHVHTEVAVLWGSPETMAWCRRRGLTVCPVAPGSPRHGAGQAWCRAAFKRVRIAIGAPARPAARDHWLVLPLEALREALLAWRVELRAEDEPGRPAA